MRGLSPKALERLHRLAKLRPEHLKHVDSESRRMFGLPLDLLRLPDRRARTVAARTWAWGYLISVGWNLSEIGREFKKDYATVAHHVGKPPRWQHFQIKDRRHGAAFTRTRDLALLGSGVGQDRVRAQRAPLGPRHQGGSPEGGGRAREAGLHQPGDRPSPADDRSGGLT